MRAAIGWYQAQAVRAGYAVGRQARDGDQILAGTRGDQAFYLIASPGQGDGRSCSTRRSVSPIKARNGSDESR